MILAENWKTIDASGGLNAMCILLTVLISLALCYWWMSFASFPCPNFPPGPVGLPLLGYLPIVSEKNILTALDKVHDKYGDIASVNIGPSKRVVVIGNYQGIKDAFKDDNGNGRPLDWMYLNEEFRYGNGYDCRGLVFSVGQEWTEQRRFALKKLRDFGFGKSSMEDFIHEEIELLQQLLDQKLNQTLTMSLVFNLSVVNGLWTLLTGSRLSLEDSKLKELVEIVDEWVKSWSNASILNMFPSLRHVAPGFTGWTLTKEANYRLIALITEAIDQHMLHFTKNIELIRQAPRDFIDTYLIQIEDSDKGSSFHEDLGHHNLRSVILDLMLAGIETTSTALTWSILLMTKYPDIQKKVQSEIKEVIGDSKRIHMVDKINLPYTEAVTQEVLRFTCIGPLGTPHYSRGDIQILDGKFMIPKGTLIYPNLHRVTRDPKHFQDPNTFKPDRFLDDYGKFVKNSHNIVFGIGKRDCPGKSLALTQFFLFFASLMQRYTFTSTKAHLREIDISPNVMFTQSPKSFEVILKKN